MCGIFGFHHNLDLSLKSNFDQLTKDLKLYSKLSKLRGSDTYGLAFKINKKNIIYKLNENPLKIQKRQDYKKFLKNQLNENSKNFLYIGQNRLVTNGSKSSYENNQPIISENIIGIHNGIFSNIYSILGESLDNQNHEGLNVKSDSLLFYNLLYLLKVNSIK